MKMHFFFFFIIIFFLPLTSTTTTPTHNRRVLHQPFFPQDSPVIPPAQSPPSPSAVPFTPSSKSAPPNDQPFFPSVASPPPPPPSPPSPSSSASFPANISSLDLPTSPKSKPVSSKLIATAVTLVIAAAVVIAIAVFLRVRRRRRYNQDSWSFSDEKTHRSDNSNRVVFNSGANNGGGSGDASNNNRIPKLTRPSQTSSEFLYLGTLVSSHGGIDANSNGRANNAGDDGNLRKLDSPELRPLPPLAAGGGGGGGGRHGHGVLQGTSSENAEVESSRDEEFEEYYSPRGSIGSGSGSRRAFAAVPVDNYESRRIIGSGSSSSYSSSSGSGSPARSVSLSISPPVSLSPIRSRPKSPDLVAIQTAPPPPPSRPPPPPPPPPPYPLRIPSPDVGLLNNHESSPTLSNSSSDHNSPPPPARIPPPPPPPPLKHWETPSPRTPTPPAGPQPLLKPPVLITPARPVAVNTDQISPIELLPEIQENLERGEQTPKPKLKPLHWDKVRASSDREMVWDQLKSSSFKLNEEMIETLFIVKSPNPTTPNEKATTRRPILPSPPSQENRVLDPKKSQNIAISLRALNVTIEEVCDALLEGNADTLGTELLESLLKMAPTKEEERKLKDYKDDSPIKLGPAEKFLISLLDVPFAFKRIDAMLYISNFDSEIEYLKRSFETLEAACEELRNSRMFLKLLEAVLKTGNRMNVGTNRGDAHAFKLDTLLKLVDVKGTDGKTTLLHFVVQEIIRSEGARLCNNDNSSQIPKSTVTDDAKCRKLGLQVVSGLSSDLSNVKKAAAMDSEVLNGDVLKLSKGIANILEVVRLNETVGSDEENKTRFSESMNKFMKMAEEEIIRIQAQESVALSLVKEITEYFHGNSAKEEAHPLRIFMVVRDFLTVLDRVCKEVGTINERIVVSSAYKFPVPVNPTMPSAFNGFPGRRQYSSSDDESSSSQ